VVCLPVIYLFRHKLYIHLNYVGSKNTVCASII
jgi:hypothetical protein